MFVPHVFDANVTGTMCGNEFMRVCVWMRGN